jgi:hypothetical protein
VGAKIKEETDTVIYMYAGDMVAAVRAMKDIKDMKLIALGTVMTLFRIKVVPTLTYSMN